MNIVESSRAAQRKERQLAIEKEQRMEEAEALKMLLTDHQTKLARSFSSVKTEFSDLDGKAWSPSSLTRNMQAARRGFQAPPPGLTPPPLPAFSGAPSATIRFPSTPSRPAGMSAQFSILTNSDLEQDNIEDTIRVSKARLRYRGRIPSSGSMAKDPVHKALFPCEGENRSARPPRIDPCPSGSDPLTIVTHIEGATPIPSPQGSPSSMFRFFPPTSPTAATPSSPTEISASHLLARARGRKRSRSPAKNAFQQLINSVEPEDQSVAVEDAHTAYDSESSQLSVESSRYAQSNPIALGIAL